MLPTHCFKPVQRCKPGQILLAQLLGPIMGVTVHWTPERGSMPCFAVECVCGLPVQYRAYVPARVRIAGAGDPAAFRTLELTAPAVVQLEGERANLFGIVLKLSRGTKKTSALCCEVCPRQPVPSGAEPWDVRPALCAFYQLARWGDVAKQKPVDHPNILRFRGA